MALGNIHTKTLARVGTYNIDADRVNSAYGYCELRYLQVNTVVRIHILCSAFQGYSNRDTSIWSKKHSKLMREKNGKLPGTSILTKEVSAMVVSSATIKTKKRPLGTAFAFR